MNELFKSQFQSLVLTMYEDLKKTTGKKNIEYVVHGEETKLDQLIQMGFQRDLATEALANALENIVISMIIKGKGNWAFDSSNRAIRAEIEMPERDE